MDCEHVQRVVEETDPRIVQRYLDTGRWILLSVAPGQSDDLSAYHLYSLGWLGSAGPQDDGSEFPVTDDLMVL